MINSVINTLANALHWTISDDEDHGTVTNSTTDGNDLQNPVPAKSPVTNPIEINTGGLKEFPIADRFANSDKLRLPESPSQSKMNESINLVAVCGNKPAQLHAQETTGKLLPDYEDPNLPIYFSSDAEEQSEDEQNEKLLEDDDGALGKFSQADGIAESATEDSTGSSSDDLSNINDDEDDKKKQEKGVYEVERILDARQITCKDSRRGAGLLQYLIKWRGYSLAECTWEPLENLRGCRALLHAYHSQKGSPVDCEKAVIKVTEQEVALIDGIEGEDEVGYEPHEFRKAIILHRSKLMKCTDEKAESKQKPRKLPAQEPRDVSLASSSNTSGISVSSTFAANGVSQKNRKRPPKPCSSSSYLIGGAVSSSSVSIQATLRRLSMEDSPIKIPSGSCSPVIALRKPTPLDIPTSNLRSPAAKRPSTDYSPSLPGGTSPVSSPSLSTASLDSGSERKRRHTPIIRPTAIQDWRLRPAALKIDGAKWKKTFSSSSSLASAKAEYRQPQIEYLVEWSGRHVWVPDSRLTAPCKAAFHEKFPWLPPFECSATEYRKFNDDRRDDYQGYSSFIRQVCEHRQEALQAGIKSEIRQSLLNGGASAPSPVFREEHVESAAFEAEMLAFQRAMDAELNREGLAPVTIVNEVDWQGPPQDFTFITRTRIAPRIAAMALKATIAHMHHLKKAKNTDVGCSCTNGCPIQTKKDKTPEEENDPLATCPCNRYYDGNGRLHAEGIVRMIHECGRACLCPPTCQNRVIQRGRCKIPLEIYRIGGLLGWGLRIPLNYPSKHLSSASDDGAASPVGPYWSRNSLGELVIPAGTFIEEYAGECITAQDARARQHHDYLFDLDGECEWGQESAFTVDARHFGNAARFINHSCEPNLRVVAMVDDGCCEKDRSEEDNRDEHLDEEDNRDEMMRPHGIAFFALKDIYPMGPLTFDYSGLINQQQSHTPTQGPTNAINVANRNGKYRRRSSLIKKTLILHANHKKRGGNLLDGQRCFCGASRCRKIVIPEQPDEGEV